MNSVKYLQNINFSQLTLSEKVEIKSRGRPTPVLFIQQKSTSRKKEYKRHFTTKVYENYEWLCGCDEKNALFCFPCLLFGGDLTWTKIGMFDLKHLHIKIKKHENSTKHLNNVVDLSLLGKVNIAHQLDSAYKLSVARHNEQVRKNREALSKIIDCIKFCGKFELPLRGHDESTDSENPGVFRGLVEFSCSLDSSFETHLKNATVFKGTSKSIQNELLETMLEVCKNNIKAEIKQAEYLAVMCDETTDIYDKTQMVIILRYELQGKPVERFWGFFNPINQTAEALSTLLFEELQILIGNSSYKLIAQTYDGAAALSGVKNGVQTRMKEVYKNAHFIHCYAHQLNLIIEKATSKNSSVRIFFNSLSGIPAFFSKSPQRMAVLENVAGHRIPKPSATRWYFKSRTVNAVKEMKDALIECCSILEGSKSRETGFAAAGIKRVLNDFEFEFWLQFFSKLMHHVDILFSQLQSRNIDSAKVNDFLKAFNCSIQKLRDDSHLSECIFTFEPIKRKKHPDKSVAVKEVCDEILMQCRERFSFTNHLEASKLFLVNNFSIYTEQFPNYALKQTVAAYPMLEEEKLKAELSVLYTRNDLFKSGKIIDMLTIMNDNNLGSSFPNTTKLLKILITTPMTTAEAERCFSTLKRIKTFLRSTMTNERLSALAMLSIENTMISEMKNFNEEVIEHFVKFKNRRAEFKFK